MPLLPSAASRPVLLIANDLARAVSSQFLSLFEGAEVVECPSSDAAWSALVTGRRYSAVVTRETDAHLGATATRLGVPLLTLDGANGDLENAVASLRRVPRASWAPTTEARQPPEGVARLVTVCGTGGTGTSTIAAGLASSLAAGLAFSLAANPAAARMPADRLTGASPA